MIGYMGAKLGVNDSRSVVCAMQDAWPSVLRYGLRVLEKVSWASDSQLDNILGYGPVSENHKWGIVAVLCRMTVKNVCQLVNNKNNAFNSNGLIKMLLTISQ
jgi:hypothetical protein